jgi:SAM-dependent methyltransferase
MIYRINYDNCPLCESKDFFHNETGDCSSHPLYKAELSPLMKWMKCKACNHMFLDGYFNDDGNKLIFSDTHKDQQAGFEAENQRIVSSRIIDKVIPFQKSGAWLDIGFGDASLLFTAQEYGFYPVGIDLRLQNVVKLNNLGIEAHCNEVQKIDFKRKFSVVSMMDVLEHVPYPKEMLSAIVNILDDSGIVLISMPNTENIIWREMIKQKTNPYLGEIEHYHNFSRTRLFDLLEEFSIKPLYYSISERYRVCMEIIAQK